MPSQLKTNSITRNTTYLTVAFILQKILSFIYFVYYSNIIGFTDTGKYIFAISFVTIFGIIVDLGFSPVLIREVSRNRGNAQRYLNNILGVKLYFSIIAALSIIILVNLLRYPLVTQQLVWLVMMVMIVESFTLTFYGVFRGFQNLKYEALGSVLFQIITFTSGFIGLSITHNPLILGLAIIIGSVGNLVFAIIFLRKKLNLSLKVKWHHNTLRFLVRTAVPFFIAGVFIKIYAYVDIVMLSLFKGDDYVGWYSIAYKLTYSLQFLPIALSNAIYPAFSRLFIEAKDKLSKSFERGLQYVIILSIPVSIGAAYLAADIVNTLWPTFSESIPALRIGIAGLFFVFANFIISSFLNACNRQKINTINIGLTMLVNIIMNLILIPKFGHNGAALSAVGSAVFLFIIGTIWTSRITKINFGWIIIKLFQATFSAVIMILILQIINYNLFINIAIGAMVYVVVLFIVRGITVNDIRIFWKSLARKKDNQELTD
ncbi:flippase [Patescibacteria group bacterium]